MPRSFDSFAVPVNWSDPKSRMRLLLAALLLANVIALVAVVSPPGGTSEELEGELTALRSQFAARKAAVERLRRQVETMDQTRAAGEGFESRYFTDRRVASSTFVAELTKAAQEAGIKPKEHGFVFEAVEGSDTLSMMTITANYEGTYLDLVQFLNRLDRSARFLILDTLTASPQQGGGLLNVQLKLNAFVREENAS